MTDEECEIFVAYFGTIEIRRDVAKSRIILRNYLLQRISRFQVDGIIKNISFTHNYIFGLAPSDHRIYILRIDSFFVYSLDLDAISENLKFEHLANIIVETERMDGKVSCNDTQIPELAHCKIERTEESMKSNLNKIEDFLICTTNQSCFLARNMANNEPSIYRIFTENKTNDFQLLQFGSAQSIRQLSAGNDHILILTVNGMVYSMGTGSRGELGHGTVECEQQPRLVECLSSLIVVQVACGGWHSVALTDDGDVYLWGWNKCGQLGDCCGIGEILDLPVPLDINEIIIGIAARGSSTLLRRADQSMFCFGNTAMI
ncbi:regulator of condensation [Onchocerca flexuosa]|uniref:Regulator of condensation n=1 Tax=Onchocerca flexuosa TaxID=387005 RepID=A0A238BL11_9BILA|nr:regulator of condensation [Onchocerca flexuosa]